MHKHFQKLEILKISYVCTTFLLSRAVQFYRPPPPPHQSVCNKLHNEMNERMAFFPPIKYCTHK